MSYYSDVYLKRLNRNGNTLQTRVAGEMVSRFGAFLNRSPNKIVIYNDSAKTVIKGEGVLQSETNTEKEVVDYLLTPVTDTYNGGYIFYSVRNNTTELQKWLILGEDKYQTLGYHKYEVILLDNDITWIGTDNLQHSAPAHYCGDFSNNGRDKALKSLFKLSGAAIEVPSNIYHIVVPYDSSISRSTQFKIEGMTWEVLEIDKISAPGVLYITLTEVYNSKATVAQEEKLDLWNLTTSLGNSFEISIDENNPTVFDVVSYYNGIINTTIEPIVTSTSGAIITKISKNKYSIYGANINGTINLKYNEITANITVKSKTISSIDLTCSGSSIIRKGQTALYVINVPNEYTTNITVTENLEIISNVSENNIQQLTIKGNAIGTGNCTIIGTHDGASKTIVYPIEVISPWM